MALIIEPNTVGNRCKTTMLVQSFSSLVNAIVPQILKWGKTNMLAKLAYQVKTAETDSLC